MKLCVKTIPHPADTFWKLDDKAMFDDFVAGGIDPVKVLNAFTDLMGEKGRDEMIGCELQETLRALDQFVTSDSKAFRNVLPTAPVLESVAAALRRQKRYYQNEVDQHNMRVWVGASMALR